mgnify:CR=1 FL=1
MMQDVDAFREKLEVLPPEVLAKWLAANQEHPLAYVGLGLQREHQQLRAGVKPEPTSTVLQDQLGGQGMGSLPMPVDPRSVPPEVAGGINTPQDMSQMVATRPGIERGVSNLPVPNTMYGNNGGIVGFANGDLVGNPEDIPMITDAERLAEAAALTPDMEESTGPMLDSRLDSATDWAGDVGSGVADWAKENPIEAGLTGLSTGLMAIPTPWTAGAGAGIKGMLAAYKGLSAIQKARRLAGTPLRVASSVGRGVRNVGTGVGRVGQKLVTRPISTKVSVNTPIGKAVGTRMGRKFSTRVAGRNLALAYGGGKAAGAGYDYLTDPREMPDHPVTAGGDPTPADLRNKQTEAVAFLEAQKKAAAEAAAAKAAADAGDDPDPPKVPKKDRDISEKNMLLMELGLGMLGDTDTTGGALGSLGRSGGSALKSLAVRKAAKADREFKQATLDLQKKSLEAETRKMDLVYDAAIRNSGMSQKELMTLRATFQDKEYPQILADARAKLTAMNDENWFFNRMSTSELNAEAKKLADAEAKKIFKMRQITSLFGASGISGLASLTGGGVPPADGYSAELIGG